MSHSVWNKQKRWAWVLSFRPKPPMLSVLSVKTNQNSQLETQRNLLNREGKFWSGRVDLNHRPPGPEPGALARLRYAPTVSMRKKAASCRDIKNSTGTAGPPDRISQFPQSSQSNRWLSPTVQMRDRRRRWPPSAAHV